MFGMWSQKTCIFPANLCVPTWNWKTAEKKLELESPVQKFRQKFLKQGLGAFRFFFKEQAYSITGGFSPVLYC